MITSAETVFKQKKKTKTAAQNGNHEEEDDEDECGYYYKPVVQPQVPIVDTTMGHANTHEDSDQDIPVLSADEPITNTNESETQQENVLCLVKIYNQLKKHRMRVWYPHVQIQVKKTDYKGMTYQGEKDEPKKSSPMTNLEFQHAKGQHRHMKCITCVNPVTIEKFSL